MAEPEQILKLRRRAMKEAEKVTILTNMPDIINRLLGIMKKCVGEENKVSQLNLFKKVYGISQDRVSELQAWIMWEFIKRGMHRMRQRTKCFIVSKQFSVSQYSSKHQGIWNYWVADSMTDYIVYRDNIERNIRAMRRMTQKCEHSIKNKWYKEDWSYK